VNDLLYIEGHFDEIIVKCITAAELLDIVGNVLSDPALITVPEPLPPATSARRPDVAGSKKFCPQCGVPIGEGKKFCNNCGAKVS
jgi:hypothetical protein